LAGAQIPHYWSVRTDLRIMAALSVAVTTVIACTAASSQAGGWVLWQKA
jgi:hypothetical protein